MIRKCDAVIGNGEYTSSRSVWEMVEVIAQYYRDEQDKRLTASVYYSILSDGSTGRNVVESEIIYVRYYDVQQQEVVTEFFKLQPLDRSQSADGKSFDAKSIVAAFKKAIHRRLPEMWDALDDHLIAGSYDGASVMLGENGGVATLLLVMVPHFIATHAVAHNLQRAGPDAWELFPFMEKLNQILKDCYAYYHVSAKRTGSLNDVADALGEAALKFSKMHGIRWMAAQTRAISVLLHNWQSVVVDLREIANESIGLFLSETSSDNTAYLDRKFYEPFDNPALPKNTKKLFVKNMEVSTSQHGKFYPVDSDFQISNGSYKVSNKLCGYVGETVQVHVSGQRVEFPNPKGTGTSRWLVQVKSPAETSGMLRVKYSDGSSMPKSKGEIVSLIMSEQEEALRPLHEYQLELGLRDYRAMVSFHFLCDVNSELKSLSLTFQSGKLHGHELCFSDCIAAIDDCQNRLSAMQAQDGQMLQEFYATFDADANTYHGKPLLEIEAGASQFVEDRQRWIEELLEALQSRFASFTNSPIIKAGM
jgi:hypothetical protein